MHVNGFGTQAQRKWRPLAGDIYKINVDASLNSLIAIVGFGIVIRDSVGVFMVGKCQKQVGVSDPLGVEFLDAREGLLFA